MKILITGATGFVGPYAAEAVRRIAGPDCEIVATARQAGEHRSLGVVEALDVTDAGAVRQSLAKHRPSHVLNLAGIASPATAAQQPGLTWRVHVGGALNLANGLLDVAPEALLVHVGSGLVYGSSAIDGVPLDEAAAIAPVDSYAASKAAADEALGALVRSGLRCVLMRPFNHTGPGQSEDFVVPSFAARIARIEAGLAEPVLDVGNLEAERDFLDVRDVADAYAMALMQAESIPAGEVFNIGSGVPRRVQSLLETLLSMSTVAIAVRQDPARQRRNDLPRVVADSSRIGRQLGWQAKHDFGTTLANVLHYWREQGPDNVRR